MNIWVGDGKFVPAMVSNAKIMFKVDKVWMEDHEIDPSSINLCRYSGSWDVLKTTSSGEDDTYVYFIAESPGFSPFAITGTPQQVEITDQSLDLTDVTASNSTLEPNAETTSESKSLPLLSNDIVMVILGCAYVVLRKRR